MSIEKALKGKIYILIHPTQNGYAKIGKTQRTAEERASELTKQAKTALVGSYMVAYEEEVENCHLAEEKIHEVLQKKRVTNDREFFAITVREAIKTIREVIENLKNQQKFDFKEINSPVNWWGNLNLIWKQIFKKYLPLDFEPDDAELIEGINNIILYSRDESLRNKICDFLKRKDFLEKIGNWYVGLSNSQKKEIKTFLMRNLEKEELGKIMNLSELDCNGNMLITNLHPIIQVESLKKINCSNTSITNLDPLAHKAFLEILDISYTSVVSLAPLEKLENIKLIKCYHTDISQKEIDRFKEINPNCKVLKNPSDKLIDF